MAANITLKGASHILPKVEHLGAAAGVVPASPLFDRAVAELAASLPAPLRLHGTTEKHVLKQVARGLVPDAVIDRPKSGMRVPVTGWLTGSLAGYARERLLDGLAPRGLIRRDYLERLLDPDVPAARRGMKLWQLLALESWLHAYASSRSASTNCQLALASVRSSV
jgi:asparagine synthase (glutamine-hydrolysing)